MQHTKERKPQHTDQTPEMQAKMQGAGSILIALTSLIIGGLILAGGSMIMAKRGFDLSKKIGCKPAMVLNGTGLALGTTLTILYAISLVVRHLPPQ